MASAQLSEPILARSGSSTYSQEEEESTRQNEENPSEIQSNSSVQPPPSHLVARDPLESIGAYSHLDEPPPPYEEPPVIADEPQIAPVEYSCENSPQLLVAPQSELPEPRVPHPEPLPDQVSVEEFVRKRAPEALAPARDFLGLPTVARKKNAAGQLGMGGTCTTFQYTPGPNPCPRIGSLAMQSFPLCLQPAKHEYLLLIGCTRGYLAQLTPNILRPAPRASAIPYEPQEPTTKHHGDAQMPLCGRR